MGFTQTSYRVYVISVYTHTHTFNLHRTSVKTTVVLLPLLGITWIIGLFAVNENTTVFAWIFTILNSLQVCSTVKNSIVVFKICKPI